jgi:rRNA processing protein Gar1
MLQVRTQHTARRRVLLVRNAHYCALPSIGLPVVTKDATQIGALRRRAETYVQLVQLNAKKHIL